MNSFFAEEKHIAATVNDFNTYCRFIDQQRPKLSKGLEVLGKNVLFVLNEQLHFRKEVSAPNFPQESYPYINLMFNLSLLGGLYRKVGNEKANIYLEQTKRKAEYDVLNPFEKYCFLLETYWTEYDFTELFRFGIDLFYQLITRFSRSKYGENLKKGDITNRKEYDPFFSYFSDITYHLSFWGSCLFEPVITDKKLTKYDDSILCIIPSDLGINICKILNKLKLTLWSKPYLNIMGVYTKDEFFNLTKRPFVEHLKPLFPQNSLINGVTSKTVEEQTGNYTFMVMLDKTIWRKIKLSHKHTLEDLHLAIQKAFDFDNDHLYSFFMDGKRYSQNAYHSSYGDEGPYADEAIIGELGLYKGQKILYLFDYGDSWEFLVQLMSIENEEEVAEPKIIESKGENPPQYRWEADFDDEDPDDE